MEIEPGLGPLVGARLAILEEENIKCETVLASTLQEAKKKAKRVKQDEVDIAIIGQVARCKGLIEEEKITAILRKQLPKILIINFSGGELKEANMQIKRPEGILKIEKFIKLLLK